MKREKLIFDLFYDISELIGLYKRMKKVPAGRIKPAFFVSNFLILDMLFSVIVLYNKEVVGMIYESSHNKI